MEADNVLGRRLVLAVIVSTLVISAFVIVTYNIVLGPQRLVQQMVRFALNVILCIFLYLKANWARWLASVLFVIASIYCLLVGVGTLSNGMTGVVIVIMGVVYISSAVILLFIPAVRIYFNAEIS